MGRERQNEPDESNGTTIGCAAGGEGLPKRRYLRGTAGLSAVATVILTLAGLLFYQFRLDHKSTPEEPLSDLVYVEHATEAQLDSFRHNGLVVICEPTLAVIEGFKELRIESERGREKPDGYRTELARLRQELDDIDTEARLRRIPREYEQKYGDIVLAIDALGRSLNEFEKALTVADDSNRKALYQASHEHLADARTRCLKAREFFAGDS